MLGRGSRLWPTRAFGAVGMCLLPGLVCLQPHDAIAQKAAPPNATPATGSTPTTGSTPVIGHHHGKAGDPDKHAHSTADATTADTGVLRDQPAGQRVDRNHAEEQQQALHAEIQKKFREFNAAFKKTTLAMTAKAHRPPPTGAKVDHAQGQPPSPTASAATQKPDNPQIVAHHRPAPATISTPVREASASAPTNPHGAKPTLTTLGGLAPYDPKKGAVLSGNTMHRRF